MLFAEDTASEVATLNAVECEAQLVEPGIAFEREAGRQVFLGMVLHGFLVLILQNDGDALEYDFPYFPRLRIE
jgi:hypothetical protein